MRIQGMCGRDRRDAQGKETQSNTTADDTVKMWQALPFVVLSMDTNRRTATILHGQISRMENLSAFALKKSETANMIP